MPQMKELDIRKKNTLYESILTKNKDWEYETEWRIIDIDENDVRKAGKLIEFVKPVSIYLGERHSNNVQNNSIEKNHNKFDEIRKQNPNANKSEPFSLDEFQVDINKIMDYKRKEKVELYEFDLSRDSFQLKRRKFL